LLSGREVLPFPFLERAGLDNPVFYTMGGVLVGCPHGFVNLTPYHLDLAWFSRSMKMASGKAEAVRLKTSAENFKRWSYVEYFGFSHPLASLAPGGGLVSDRYAPGRLSRCIDEYVESAWPQRRNKYWVELPVVREPVLVSDFLCACKVFTSSAHEVKSAILAMRDIYSPSTIAGARWGKVAALLDRVIPDFHEVNIQSVANGYVRLPNCESFRTSLGSKAYLLPRWEKKLHLQQREYWEFIWRGYSGLRRGKLEVSLEDLANLYSRLGSAYVF
jgi:hypothetical protein